MGGARRLHLMEFCLLETADSISQGVACFLQLRQTAQTIDGYTVEFDLLRRTAESEMQMSAGFPEACVPALCLQNVALLRQERSRVLARKQQGLAFGNVVMAARRLFGSCCGAARQDKLVARDVEESLRNNKDPEACAAYRKDKKQGMGKEKGDRMPTTSSGEVRGDGQALNGHNRRTWLRNRRCTCDSGYHLSPRRPWRKVQLILGEEGLTGHPKLPSPWEKLSSAYSGRSLLRPS